MASLIDSLAEVSPEIVRSLADRLGEPSDSIQKALQTSTAAMLGAIASHTNEPVFMSQVTNMIIAFGRSHLAGSVEAGSAFLTTLFGRDRTVVEKKIAEAAGLKNPPAAAVLASAAPLLMGLLAPKLTSSSLERIVTDDQPRFLSLIPAGVPGLSRLPGVAVAGRHHRADPEANAGKHWLWQVLLLGALLISALVWYSHRGSSL
jgi:OmpA-OmpF porin, OOP family